MEFSSISKRTEYSARGYPINTTITWTYGGTLIAADQNSLNSAMSTMERAYNTPFQNAGLYFDNGNPTQHLLISDQTISGVRVSNFNWGPGNQGQYTTFRSYSVVLQAIIPGQVALVEWNETIEVTGTGGPKFVWLDVLDGEPQQQIVQQQTTVKATQSGSAKGLFAYETNDPYWPDAEHEELRRTSRGSPTQIFGSQLVYPSTWSYSFETLDDLEGAAPNVPD